MAKIYHVGLGQRLINGLFRQLARRGLGKKYLHVLTVTGRESGVPRSVPVDVMEVDGERYLVAPYGEVNWVGNLRVAKRATLQRAGRSHTFDAVELRPDAGGPVIRQYVRSVPVTRDYWGYRRALHGRGSPSGGTPTPGVSPAPTRDVTD